MLEVKSIYLYRNKKQIFSDFSLFLKKKQIILLIGENGAGKSSLLDTIAGLIQPQSGSVKIEGRHVQEIGISKKETFTYIPHQSCLMENFTVLENLKIWIELNSLKIREEIINQKLKIFKLKNIKDQLVRNLSHGQKKKVSLSKLLFSNSKLWLLDEPLNGLDQNSHNIFKKILLRHQNNQGSILFSSHIDPKIKLTKKVILKKKINKKFMDKSFNQWNKL